VGHLLLGAVKAVNRRLVVGSAEPAVGGPELELGEVGVAPYGVDRGEQGRGVDAVADAVLDGGHGSAPQLWLTPAGGGNRSQTRFAVPDWRRIRAQHGSGTPVLTTDGRRDTGWRDDCGAGRGRGGHGAGSRDPCPDRPAPDERADRRCAVHLGAYRRESCLRDAPEAAAPRSPQLGPARRGDAGP